jgi:hypothetical protein
MPPSSYETFPNKMEQRMATRQIKMPRKAVPKTKAMTLPHSASGQRAAGICSTWIGKRKAPIRQRKPFNRRRWPSRGRIRSCRCRCMTVSVTRTHWWSCQSRHVDPYAPPASGLAAKPTRFAVRLEHRLGRARGRTGEVLLRDLRPWIGSATYSKLEHKSITPPETIEAHDV